MLHRELFFSSTLFPFWFPLNKTNGPHRKFISLGVHDRQKEGRCDLHHWKGNRSRNMNKWKVDSRMDHRNCTFQWDEDPYASSLILNMFTGSSARNNVFHIVHWPWLHLRIVFWGAQVICILFCVSSIIKHWSSVMKFIIYSNCNWT